MNYIDKRAFGDWLLQIKERIQHTRDNLDPEDDDDICCALDDVLSAVNIAHHHILPIIDDVFYSQAALHRLLLQYQDTHNITIRALEDDGIHVQGAPK